MTISRRQFVGGVAGAGVASVAVAAIRGSSADTVRGLVKFDEFGNVIGNFYIRKVTKIDGRLVNSVIKTYPDVIQFWTYDKTAFLKNPVYSRDYPPAKNLEP